MRVRSHLAILALGLLFAACATRPAKKQEPRVVTVEQLLSNPARFDGVHVLVKGFFLQPMIGDIAIYQTEPDYHHYQREAGIQLALDPNRRNLMPFQLKRCVLEGTFHAHHAPDASGLLGEITRLELAGYNF